MFWKRYDFILFAVSLGVLVVVGVILLFAGRPQTDAASTLDFTIADHPYRPTGNVFQPDPVRDWIAPVHQSWDPRAVFEVFTPPIIYFNPATDSFTLESPFPAPVSQPDFGLELVAVERALYRLQYEGFAGREGAYVVLLRNEETGLGLRGRTGQRLIEGDCVVVDFSVDRRLIEQDNGSPIIQETVVIVIYDERLQMEVILGPEPRYQSEARAVLRQRGEGGEMFSLVEEETLELEDAHYRVVKIDMEAGSVAVERHGMADESPEVRVLYALPHGASEDHPGSPAPVAPPPPGGEEVPDGLFPFPFS